MSSEFVLARSLSTDLSLVPTVGEVLTKVMTPSVPAAARGEVLRRCRATENLYYFLHKYKYINRNKNNERSYTSKDDYEYKIIKKSNEAQD